MYVCVVRAATTGLEGPSAPALDGSSEDGAEASSAAAVRHRPCSVPFRFVYFVSFYFVQSSFGRLAACCFRGGWYCFYWCGGKGCWCVSRALMIQSLRFVVVVGGGGDCGIVHNMMAVCGFGTGVGVSKEVSALFL